MNSPVIGILSVFRAVGSFDVFYNEGGEVAVIVKEKMKLAWKHLRHLVSDSMCKLHHYSLTVLPDSGICVFI